MSGEYSDFIEGTLKSALEHFREGICSTDTETILEVLVLVSLQVSEERYKELPEKISLRI